MKQKSYQNSTKNIIGKLPIWNLKDLYESPKAKKLSNDLNKLRITTKKFEKKYESKITKLSSNQLLKAIIELEDIDTKIDKINTLSPSKIPRSFKYVAKLSTCSFTCDQLKEIYLPFSFFHKYG